MKQLRLFLTVTVLMLAFSIPAFAGDMETTITSQPPVSSTVTLAGDMETTLTSNEATTTDSLKEIAMNAFQSVLSLF